jgi:hypothetical protein
MASFQAHNLGALIISRLLGWRIPACLLLVAMPFMASGSRDSFSQSTPTGWRASYKQIYFDDVETMQPVVGPSFLLADVGTITSAPGEVISGAHSIKGSYSGTKSYMPYLRTNSNTFHLNPSQSYQVTFKYRILSVPDRGFECLFYSPTGGAANVWLPSVVVNGQAGTTGTATLTNLLGPYADYEARWNIGGTGSIVIDDIEITNLASGQVVASENAEQQAPGIGSGLRLLNSSVTSDPSLVISGKGSVRLTNSGIIASSSAGLQLLGNTPYIVEFQYRMLKPGSPDNSLYLRLQPTGTDDQQLQVSLSPLLRNAPAMGTFSSGAQTAGAGSYEFYISAQPDSDVVIDNIAVYRQNTIQASTQPASFARLNQLAYPRLGKFTLSTTLAQAWRGGLAEGPPLRISLDQLEGTLAFADVIGGLALDAQTQLPDSIRRLRQLNPSIVILPYRIAEEQGIDISAPLRSDASVDFDFLKGIADDWYVRDSKGNYVPDPDYPYIRKMNISPFCPVVNGQTYITYLLNWLKKTVFASGMWDGVFFDNLFGHINGHILNSGDAALLDADYNRNGSRDETPAWISDMTRTAAVGMLQQFRNSHGNQQLILGNNGPLPDLPLAPYVNGYIFEAANLTWNASWLPVVPSMAGWRNAFDAYQVMEATARTPRINLFHICGPLAASGVAQLYSTPTAEDLQRQRFGMGTALLGDGFYWYDLHGNLSAALWFDEYSVDSTGRAVQDTSHKGYLGQPLTDAQELTPPGSLIFQEDFESGSLPSSFISNQPSAVYVSKTKGDVISGQGSLVLNNPDHTKGGYISVGTNTDVVQLAASNTYLLTFDWRIVETVDSSPGVAVYSIGAGRTMDRVYLSGIVAGDSGTARFPFTVDSSGVWTIVFFLPGGGGKVAFDNLRLYRGGVGPWRRDFENGFVLVNPLTSPRAFSADELAGTLKRTKIKRIKGTQAPDINNGQPVTGSLTLQPFDAIILLADHIDAKIQRSDVPFGVFAGGQAVTAKDSSSQVNTGYGYVQPDAATSSPSGLAIFGFRQNGVLVTEASVPASSRVQSGRLYAEVGGSIDTGVAMANPNGQPAHISFYFTDENGKDFGAGSTTIAANNQIAAFLDQSPFVGGASINGTFTFVSDLPVAVVALRGVTNERSEFVITTLPVSPLNTNDNATVVFPHFADGGGWSTEIQLVNGSSTTMTGSLQFFGQGTATTAAQPAIVTVDGVSGSGFSYSISPKSSRRFRTAGQGTVIQAGSVRAVPASGNIAPSRLSVFSYRSDGVTVSQAGVPAVRASSNLRLYVEASADSSQIQSGIAIANTSADAMTVSLELLSLAGTSTGMKGSATVPANGQLALFLNQVQGFGALQGPFQGVLRITANGSSGIYVTGIRGRNNERGDFLITTTMPFEETSSDTASDMFFPHFAAGGGYTTQFVLLGTSTANIATGWLRFISQSGKPLTLALRQ